jgi:hypothetical protein
MEEWGDDMSGFDLIVALSPASQRRALDLTRHFHLDVEYWPILDPTGLVRRGRAKLAAYRQARDQIVRADEGRGSARPRTAGGPVSTPMDDTRALVARYFAAFNAGDVDGMVDCLADDVAHHVNEGRCATVQTELSAGVLHRT